MPRSPHTSDSWTTESSSPRGSSIDDDDDDDSEASNFENEEKQDNKTFASVPANNDVAINNNNNNNQPGKNLNAYSKSNVNNNANDDNESREEESGYKPGGYHPISLNDMIGNYQVVKKLGFGHFSTVWLGKYKADSVVRYCALKVQKSAPNYTEAAEDEIKILKNLPAHKNRDFIVRLLENFTVTGPNGTHCVLAFECLGDNLLSIMKHWRYKGLPFELVTQIAFQICLGLSYMHSEMKIIHTDLKPENILVSGLRPALANKLEASCKGIRILNIIAKGNGNKDDGLVLNEKLKELQIAGCGLKGNAKRKNKLKIKELLRSENKPSSPTSAVVPLASSEIEVEFKPPNEQNVMEEEEEGWTVVGSSGKASPLTVNGISALSEFFSLLNDKKSLDLFVNVNFTAAHPLLAIPKKKQQQQGEKNNHKTSLLLGYFYCSLGEIGKLKSNHANDSWFGENGVVVTLNGKVSLRMISPIYSNTFNQLKKLLDGLYVLSREEKKTSAAALFEIRVENLEEIATSGLLLQILSFLEDRLSISLLTLPPPAAMMFSSAFYLFGVPKEHLSNSCLPLGDRFKGLLPVFTNNSNIGEENKQEDYFVGSKPEKFEYDFEIFVKIVDFGNSCGIRNKFTDNIQTRQYRSPEVILNGDYCEKTDIW